MYEAANLSAAQAPASANTIAVVPSLDLPPLAAQTALTSQRKVYQELVLCQLQRVDTRGCCNDQAPDMIVPETPICPCPGTCREMRGAEIARLQEESDHLLAMHMCV